MAKFTRVATPEERLELIILTAIASGDAAELAHIAEHVGMGRMAELSDVSSAAITAFFARLTPMAQLDVLRKLEACEW